MEHGDSTQKVGKKMAFVAWIIALAGLTWFFSDILEERLNPNQDPETFDNGMTKEVILKRNRYGHYVASGTINNQPVVFFLDTGATMVAVPEAVAQRVGLKKGRAFQTQTANGIGTSYYTRLRSLSIGNLQFNNVDAAISPGLGGEEILLGMSVLKQVDFSQQGDTLILRY